MANVLTDVSSNNLQGKIYGIIDQYLAVVTGAGDYDQTYTPVGVSNADVNRWLSADGEYEIVWYADTSDGLFHWAIVVVGDDPQTAYIHKGSNAVGPQYATWEGTVQVYNVLGAVAVSGSDTAACNQTYTVDSTSPGCSTVYLSADGLYYLVYHRPLLNGADTAYWLLSTVALESEDPAAFTTELPPDGRDHLLGKGSTDAIYPWLADWDGTYLYTVDDVTFWGTTWIPGETGIAVARGAAIDSGWKTVGGRTCLKMASNGYINIGGGTELDLSGRGAMSRVRVSGAAGVPGVVLANGVYSQITPVDYEGWDMDPQPSWDGSYYYGSGAPTAPYQKYTLARYNGGSHGEPTGDGTIWWGLFPYSHLSPAYAPWWYAPDAATAWGTTWSVYGGRNPWITSTITVERELPDDVAEGLSGWTIMVDLWVDALDGVERGVIIRRTPTYGGIISEQGGEPVHYLALGVDGKVYAYVAVGFTYAVAKQTSQMITGTWQRYIAVWDGTNLKLYLNGAQVATTTCGYSGSSPTTETFVGMMNNAHKAQDDWGLWKGSIGSLVILDRSVTASEIACNPLLAKPYGGAAPVRYV